ncbi:MAG: hypothetical protein AB8G18_19680 [Gammaproteobacteria bacterium]
MNTATSTRDELPPRSKLNALSIFVFAATTAFLTASVFLILQYKQGIPFSFVTSVILSAAAALVLPVIAGLVFRRYFSKLSYPGMVGFIVTNLLIAIGTGLFIF